MIYSNNTNDLHLLEAELKRLKELYAETLKKQNDVFNLRELRKRIKLLSARITTAGNQITSSHN